MQFPRKEFRIERPKKGDYLTLEWDKFWHDARSPEIKTIQRLLLEALTEAYNHREVAGDRVWNDRLGEYRITAGFSSPVEEDNHEIYHRICFIEDDERAKEKLVEHTLENLRKKLRENEKLRDFGVERGYGKPRMEFGISRGGASWHVHWKESSGLEPQEVKAHFINALVEARLQREFGKDYLPGTKEKRKKPDEIAAQMKEITRKKAEQDLKERVRLETERGSDKGYLLVLNAERLNPEARETMSALFDDAFELFRGKLGKAKVKKSDRR